MMVKSKSAIAYKSTDMIQLRGDIIQRDVLSETEQKAVMYIASQVKNESNEEDWYQFQYKKFAAIAGIEINGRLYKEMLDLLRGLQIKRVMFRNEKEKGIFMATMLISPRFYDSGIIEYKVDPNLLPHFKAFAAGFTMIDVADYMAIRGKYPLVLYELMLSWAAKGRVEYTVKELREKLNVPDDAYPRNIDFIKKIRLAIEEINDKSKKIQIKTEEITGSRSKVEGIIFKITKIKDTLKMTEEEKLEIETGQTTILDTIREESATTPNAPICPKCGGKVVLKNGKNGEFWGCANFKNGCKYTCDLDVDPNFNKQPDADCKKCGGRGWVINQIKTNYGGTKDNAESCDCTKGNFSQKRKNSSYGDGDNVDWSQEPDTL